MLPKKESTGIDKVPVSLLKSTVLSIAPIIALCVNIAIQTATFPVELLKGRLKLIHKDGDSDIDNFRGLTLLNTVSKVFEQLLVDQLYSYLESISVFKGNQFGFLKHSCCLSAAIQLIDRIKANQKNKYVASLFIDRKKAFDTN